MKKILLNIDGCAYQISKTGYLAYIRDINNKKPMPLDCYNVKDLGFIRYSEQDSQLTIGQLKARI